MMVWRAGSQIVDSTVAFALALLGMPSGASVVICLDDHSLTGRLLLPVKDASISSRLDDEIAPGKNQEQGNTRSSTEQ